MKYTYYILSAITVLALCSCSDFLEEEPKGLVVANEYYRNDQEARTALNGVYRTLGESNVVGHEVRQIPNDLLKRASWDEGNGLSSFTYGAENTSIATMWRGHYAVIKNCNAVIDGIAENQHNIANWQRYTAEARGIRAFLYFDLVRWFGDVPLKLNDTKNLKNLEMERTNKARVFEQIIEDLEYCAQYSMDKDDTDNGYQYGRFTTDAAHGLLAKVYLWIASVTERDKKEFLGSAIDNYQKCLEEAETVIHSGRFTLTPYYPDVFDAKTREAAQSEVLFCTQGLTGDNTGSWTGMVFGIRGSQELGGSWDNISSSDYHRMIYEPSDSVRRLWNCPRVQLLEDGNLWGWDYPKYWDTRADQKLSEQLESNNWVMWSIGKFRRYPLADPASYNYTNFGMDEPLLRYADVLLMYAEAYNEIHHDPGTYTPCVGTDLSGKNIQSAYDAVNTVRKRARIANIGIIHEDPLPRELKMEYTDKCATCVPDWRPGFCGNTYLGTVSTNTYYHYADDYEAFHQEILQERARELVAETTDRWCDLVRRGQLEKAMQNWRIHNPFISGPERGVNTPGAPEYVSKRNYLLPIPLSEINVNKKLTQNPGY